MIRFEVGKCYRADGKEVCLGRFTDDKGVERVRFLPVSDAREELKEFGFVSGDICNEYAVRVFKDVERATPCEDTEDIEDFDIRADKPLGVMKLEKFDDDKAVKRRRSRKSKDGNPIIGLILIVIIALIIKSCSGI